VRSRFKDVLASFNGMTLNTAAIGRQLVLSRTTAAAWIREYERCGILRLLPPDSGRNKPLLLVAPDRRKELMELLQRIFPECSFSFWKSGRIRMVHLIADLGGERLGLCFQTSPVLRRQHWFPLLLALRRGVITRGLVLHAEPGASLKERVIVAVPWSSFVREPMRWILGTADDAARRAAVWRFNRERLAAWAAHR